jgi:hypothetical protein
MNAGVAPAFMPQDTPDNLSLFLQARYQRLNQTERVEWGAKPQTEA